MNKLIAALKKIRLGKILTVLMAGLLLFVSTACNRVQAQTPSTKEGPRQEVPAGKLAVPGKENPRPEVPEAVETDRFKKGTMNEFSDVDPRAKNLEKAAAGEAGALKENAQRRIDEKSVDSLEQYTRNYQQGTPLGERVKRLGEDVGSSTKELTEGVSKGTKRGTENIKDNTSDATKGVDRNVSRTAEDVKGATSDLNKGVKRAADDASSYVKGKADRAAEATRNAM